MAKKKYFNPDIEITKPSDNSLFDFEPTEEWQEEWKNMPEYINKDLHPWFTLKVNFLNKSDLEEFSKLVQRTISSETKSIWYPKQGISTYMNKRYVDDET